MTYRPLLLLGCLVCASLAHAAPPALPEAGQTCVLKKPVKVSAEEKGKGEKLLIKKGATVTLVMVERPWAQVRGDDDTSGYIKLPMLRAACKTFEGAAAPAEAAAAAPAATPAEGATEAAAATPPPDAPPPPATPAPDAAATTAAATPAPDAAAPAPEGTEAAPAEAVAAEAAPAEPTVTASPVEDGPAWLTVAVTEREATVALDGTPVGKSPLDSVKTTSGTHQLSIEKAGFLPYTKELSLSARTETEVRVGLKPTPEYNAQWLSESESQRSLGSIVGIAGAGLLAVGGGLLVYGQLSEKKLTEDVAVYNRDPDGSGFKSADLASRRDTQDLLNIVGPVVTGLGAVVLCSGLVMRASANDPERYKDGGPATFSLGLFPGLGATLSGAF